MKIEIETEQRIYKTLEIDTEDYITEIDEDEKIFAIAELINNAKEHPYEFFKENEDEVIESSETLNIKVSKKD